MTEAENPGVIEEIAAPEAEDMSTAHAETEQQEVQKAPENDAEMNFRRLRESNEQLQRERDQEREAREKDREMFQELIKRSSSSVNPAPEPEPEVDAYAGLASDDWLTVDQQKKLDAIREKRNADSTAQAIKKALEEDRAKRHKEETPQRLKNRFGDFEAVVTTENVNKLRDLDPDIAQALSLISDEEAQAVAAYKYIKAFLPQATETTATKKRIQENANQPKSLSATGANSSPLSKAGAFEQGLTPDLQKQLFAEMQSCARQS